MAILPCAQRDDELCRRVSLECATATESNPVSFRELLESWRATASAPRTARTFAVHLPLDEAAQLEALAQMFPGRAPEQLITELLGAALKEVAAAMPYVAGKRVISTDEQGDPIYEDVGPTPRFLELTRGHRARLEGDGGERAARRPKTAGRAAKRKPRSRSAR
jgi:hypothetical protein